MLKERYLPRTDKTKGSPRKRQGIPLHTWSLGHPFVFCEKNAKALEFLPLHNRNMFNLVLMQSDVLQEEGTVIYG